MNAHAAVTIQVIPAASMNAHAAVTIQGTPAASMNAHAAVTAAAGCAARLIMRVHRGRMALRPVVPA
eukprot:351595-Chlamydomonas_euryale.AAC.2